MTSKSKLSLVKSKDKKFKKEQTYTTEHEKLKSDTECKIVSDLNTTPISYKNRQKDDTDDEVMSPLFMRFTQDTGDDDIDVVWDWESPKTKVNHNNIRRKRLLHSSPKIPRKQIVSNQNKQSFSSLKAGLEELANTLKNSNPENDDTCLVIDNNDIFVKPDEPQVPTTDMTELFDDSFDNAIVQCSQQVEESFQINHWCSTIMNKNLENTKSDRESTEDDSFDVFLEQVNNNEIDILLSQTSSSGTSSLEPVILNNKPLTTKISSPRSIARTNSAPLAKPTTSAFGLVSRTKSAETNRLCSPEEIEKKRQEARVKLEYKRKQHEIEKKRLEALERLKRNRMQRILSSQNATNPSKSTLHR